MTRARHFAEAADKGLVTVAEEVTRKGLKVKLSDEAGFLFVIAEALTAIALVLTDEEQV